MEVCEHFRKIRLPLRRKYPFSKRNSRKPQRPDRSSNDPLSAASARDRDAIQVRIVQFPKMRLGNGQAGLDGRIAGRQFAIHISGLQGLALTKPGQTANAKRAWAAAGRVLRTTARTLDDARLRIGSQVQVGQIDGRGQDQVDRVNDAAVVIKCARVERNHLAAPRNLGQAMPSIGSFFGLSTRTARRFFARFESAGHIQHENAFAALVAAHLHAVQPRLGQVIDRPKAEQARPWRCGLAGASKSRQYHATP